MEGHKSVLLSESIEMLNLKPGMTIVDGTLGGGGHATAILDKISPNGRLIAIDKDVAAIERVKSEFENQSVEFVHDDFKNISSILQKLNIEKIDGVILDLGVSSYQLDDGSRGFSYNSDARLDMRMNREDKISAYEIINSYEEIRLARIIAEYGEERWAKRIAKFIAEERKIKPIESTGQLSQIIKNAIPASARQDGPHPAKRTFQAIRIEVNGELGGLNNSLFEFARALTTGSRICVITFHSLEDRIIKTAMKKLENPCECPKEFPVCVCGKEQQVKVLTKKPILPNQKEITENPRARSAKLRVCEKV